MTFRVPPRYLVAASALALVLGSAAYYHFHKRPALRTGSKAFTESVVLGEALALLGEHGGVETGHRQSLSGTQVAWRALVTDGCGRM